MFSFPWDVGIRENDLWSVKGERMDGEWREGGGGGKVKLRDRTVRNEEGCKESAVTSQ